MDNNRNPIHLEENKNLSTMEIISMRNSILASSYSLSEEEKRQLQQKRKEWLKTLDTVLSPIEKEWLLHTDSNRI